MLNEREKNDTEASGSGATMTPKQVQFLKIAIGIMSVLLVLGFILFLIGLYRQASRGAAPVERGAAERQTGTPVPLLDVPLRPGMQVTSVLADSGRLIVHMHGAASDEIIIVDLATGLQQQRIILAPLQ